MSDLIPKDFMKNFDSLFNDIEAYINKELKGAVRSMFDGLGFDDLKVTEKPDKIIMSIAVPKDLKDKLNIRVDNEKVEIGAQTDDIKQSAQSTNQSYKRIYHCYSLPKGVLSEKTKVYYKDDNLIIEIPRKEISRK